ncbi:hypothetical protein [Levilactobacillus bambusae]|uniref:Uncharacterized protein n=1 Tax=Levilactobacillus bambusae TaxID=2024736 RepID=A0A2V1N106_9LACO|nr:hypothetical protein [Levilactobacillus bambusae]PWG00971.1 hypothetical protein DCM90_02000 [Levilactobacillus bambusae]
MHFGSLDKDATRVNAENILKSYHELKQKLAQLKMVHLSGIVYDGMPKSASNVNGALAQADNRLIEMDEIEAELKMIENVIQAIAGIDEQSEKRSALLWLRYVKNYSNQRCRHELAKKYEADYSIPKSTFNDYRKEAAFQFALTWPDTSILVFRKVLQKSSH